MNFSDESEKEEEANIFLMVKYEDNAENIPTYYFTYNELFRICKKFDSESSKLKNILLSLSHLSLVSKKK